MAISPGRTEGKFLAVKRAQWIFLGRWLLANALGGALYWVVGLTIGHVACTIMDPQSSLSSFSVGCAALVVAMAGLTLGTTQSFVVEARIARRGWWVLASGLAWPVAWLMFAMVAEGIGVITWTRNAATGSTLTGFASEAMGGALLGIMQWCVLRRKYSRAGWWVLATALGWALGGPVGQAVFRGLNAPSVSLSGALVYLGIGGVAFGLVNGAVTGVVLVGLPLNANHASSAPASRIS